MLEKLAGSGLVPEDLDAYPVQPVGATMTPGFLIPYHDPNMYRIRYDRLVDKYIGPKGRVGVWWSPRSDIETFRSYSALYVVEGELKAAALQKRFPMLNVLGIGGCWMFQHKVHGTGQLLPDIVRAVTPGQEVHIIFDGDVETKLSIQQAAHAFTSMLESMGAKGLVYKPPVGKGADDWLVASPNAQLSDLVHIPLENLEISRKNLYKKLQLSLNQEGFLILNELNAYKLLQDHFAGNTYNDKRLGVIHNGDRHDKDIMYEGLTYLQERISPAFRPATVRHASNMLFEQLDRDLIQELVKDLEWDGVERLATWGSEHFETKWPEYADEWGRLLITGLGLRLLKPGTKVDHCCILVGGQGIGKTTFFEELSSFGGFSFYHSCTELETGEQRDQATAFRQATVVDLAEGVVFNSRKTHIDAVKQIISQVEDRHRQVYRTVVSVVPRGFIFVGTTNRRDQLSDLTGSRRFLNLEVTKIKKLSYEKKLQLLAEVTAKEGMLRESDWYNLKVDISTAPQELQEEHEHIMDSRELMNTQFHKSEAIVDFITETLDSGKVARVTTRDFTDVMFVTAHALNILNGQSGPGATNFMSRMLNQLSSSPAYKYDVIAIRVRVPQFTFINPQQKELYLGHYDDPKRMLQGYVAIPRKRKDVPAMPST